MANMYKSSNHSLGQRKSNILQDFALKVMIIIHIYTLIMKHGYPRPKKNKNKKTL